MEQIYTDKEVLGDALTAEKAATEHYNTFANECVHASVRDAILKCLDQEHAIQQDVFEIMHGMGYYPTPEAQEQKVQEAKQKYSQCVKNTAM
ncbi:MAG: spore coat protein [Bacteroides sp.]